MGDLFRTFFCVSLIALAVDLVRAQSVVAVSETAQVAQRQVAVTIDDVPGEAIRASQRCDAAAYRTQNIKMLEALRRNKVPATGFVVEGGRCVPRRAVVPEILKMWLDAGVELGNHTYSHPDLNTMTVAAYEADIVRGESALGKALAERGKKIKYFRYPMLHTGKNAATKKAIEDFLTSRGYIIAPKPSTTRILSLPRPMQKPSTEATDPPPTRSQKAISSTWIRSLIFSNAGPSR